MRPLADLIDPTDAGAEVVRKLLAGAVNPVEVVRGDRARGERALLRVEESTATPLGALAYRLGGLVFDYGWLRVLGAGAPRFARDLASWNLRAKSPAREGRGLGALSMATEPQGGEGAMNGPPEAPRLPGALLVADDVVGGFFAVDRGAFGGSGGVHYFAPDTRTWDDLEIDYLGLLEWACNGDLDSFYADSRWPGWEPEVMRVGADHGLDFDPPLLVESEARTRRRVPLEELWARAASAKPV